jgi:hypothetical protein
MVKNMYNNDFVLAIKLNNQKLFLEERKDHSIAVPFGAEYSLRLKNKNSRRALVKIFIDGENVSGNGYIVDRQSHIDIKRFAEVEKAFKVAALDSSDAIENGKNGPNDDRGKGVIEAHFYLEKERPVPPVVIDHHYHHYHDVYLPRPYPYRTRPWYGEPWYGEPWYGEVWRGSDHLIGANSLSKSMSINNVSSCSMDGASFACSNDSLSLNDTSKSLLRGMSLESLESAMPRNPVPKIEQDACTVEGSYSDQKFGVGYIDVEDKATICTLILKGYVPDAVEIVAPTQFLSPMFLSAPKETDDELKSLQEEEAKLQAKLELKKRIAELNKQLETL